MPLRVVQSKRVNVAVLGAGYWGTKLTREYVAIEDTSGDAHLAWVVDSSEPALKAIKNEVHPDTRLGSDYRSVVTDPSVDAVHIAIPNPLHYEIARSALESGKHVLLEKPLSTTSRDAFKLAALADEAGLVLQVGHIFRFNNGVRMVRKIIKGKHIGRVNYARLTWATYMTPPPGRDIVSDLGPHPVDILNFLLNEWPIWIDAIGSSYHNSTPGAEDMAFINLEFPDRVLANVYLSWIQHGAKERSFQIVGESGTVYCDALNQTVSIHTRDSATEIPRSTFPSSRQLNGDAESPSGNPEPNNTIRDMEYHFIDRIRGRGPQITSATIGARNVAVLEAITSSMRRVKPAQLFADTART
jgi:UDP-N-acetylglucosamine 3-dehydrogenase